MCNTQSAHPFNSTQTGHEQHSNNIIEVQDVETLIRVLADTPPDLLLLDWRLNGSPASDTCRLLQEAYPHLKIIILSVDANDEAAAKDAGAGFVYKGAVPDKLIATLTPLLRKENQSSKLKKN